jgi:hypothetical protein
MSRTPLPPDLTDLCLRAQRACEGVATTRAALEGTLAQTRQLIAEACQIHPINWCANADGGIVALFSTADRDSNEAAHEALYVIRNILNEFPLHWQIAIVKALGARTAVLAQQQQQAPRVLSA